MNEQLYLVIREAKAHYCYLRAICWHTRATSKAAAVRKFRELCPGEAQKDHRFAAPRADLVNPGAIFFV